MTSTRPALTTPLPNQSVSGSAVAVAAIQGPSQDTTVFPPVRVTVANTAVQTLPDIVEELGLKTQVIPIQPDQVVVTADGVLVVLPTDALASEDTLDIVEVDVADAPAPLPGDIAAGPWRLETLNGLARFTTPVTLRLPYADADQNGFVDGKFPQLDETQLTLWFFDIAQGWRPLANAVVIPSLNVVVVNIDQPGIFGIFRATDHRVGIIGDAANDVDLPRPQGVLSGASNAVGFSDIGLDITPPFVTAWDTTQLSDGDYELRAICADTPTSLIEFQTQSGSGGGSCFIATAAYGTPWTPQVRVLRAFRDTYLQTNAPGRWLVAQYYRLSPPLADYIRNRTWLRTLTRAGLTPVAWTVQVAMFLKGWSLLILLGLGVVGSVGVRWRLCGKRCRQ